MSRATVLVKLQSVLGSPTGPDRPIPLAMSALSEGKDVFSPSLSLSRSLARSSLPPSEQVPTTEGKQHTAKEGRRGADGEGQRGQTSIWTQTFPTDSACQAESDPREGDGATAVSSARAAAVMDGDNERKKE